MDTDSRRLRDRIQSPRVRDRARKENDKGEPASTFREHHYANYYAELHILEG